MPLLRRATSAGEYTTLLRRSVGSMYYPDGSGRELSALPPQPGRGALVEALREITQFDAETYANAFWSGSLGDWAIAPNTLTHIAETTSRLDTVPAYYHASFQFKLTARNTPITVGIYRDNNTGYSITVNGTTGSIDLGTGIPTLFTAVIGATYEISMIKGVLKMTQNGANIISPLTDPAIIQWHGAVTAGPGSGQVIANYSFTLIKVRWWYLPGGLDDIANWSLTRSSARHLTSVSNSVSWIDPQIVNATLTFRITGFNTSSQAFIVGLTADIMNPYDKFGLLMFSDTGVSAPLAFSGEVSYQIGDVFKINFNEQPDSSAIYKNDVLISTQSDFLAGASQVYAYIESSGSGDSIDSFSIGPYASFYWYPRVGQVSDWGSLENITPLNHLVPTYSRVVTLSSYTVDAEFLFTPSTITDVAGAGLTVSRTSQYPVDTAVLVFNGGTGDREFRTNVVTPIIVYEDGDSYRIRMYALQTTPYVELAVKSTGESSYHAVYGSPVRLPNDAGVFSEDVGPYVGMSLFGTVTMFGQGDSMTDISFTQMDAGLPQWIPGSSNVNFMSSFGGTNTLSMDAAPFTSYFTATNTLYQSDFNITGTGVGCATVSFGYGDVQLGWVTISDTVLTVHNPVTARDVSTSFPADTQLIVHTNTSSSPDFAGQESVEIYTLALNLSGPAPPTLITSYPSWYVNGNALSRVNRPIYPTITTTSGNVFRASNYSFSLSATIPETIWQFGGPGWGTSINTILNDGQQSGSYLLTKTPYSTISASFKVPYDGPYVYGSFGVTTTNIFDETSLPARMGFNTETFFAYIVGTDGVSNSLDPTGDVTFSISYSGNSVRYVVRDSINNQISYNFTISSSPVPVNFFAYAPGTTLATSISITGTAEEPIWTGFNWVTTQTSAQLFGSGQSYDLSPVVPYQSPNIGFAFQVPSAAADTPISVLIKAVDESTVGTFTSDGATGTVFLAGQTYPEVVVDRTLPVIFNISNLKISAYQGTLRVAGPHTVPDIAYYPVVRSDTAGAGIKNMSYPSPAIPTGSSTVWGASVVPGNITSELVDWDISGSNITKYGVVDSQIYTLETLTTPYVYMTMSFYPSTESWVGFSTGTGGPFDSNVVTYMFAVSRSGSDLGGTINVLEFPGGGVADPTVKLTRAFTDQNNATLYIQCDSNNVVWARIVEGSSTTDVSFAGTPDEPFYVFLGGSSQRTGSFTISYTNTPQITSIDPWEVCGQSTTLTDWNIIDNNQLIYNGAGTQAQLSTFTLSSTPNVSFQVLNPADGTKFGVTPNPRDADLTNAYYFEYSNYGTEVYFKSPSSNSPQFICLETECVNGLFTIETFDNNGTLFVRADVYDSNGQYLATSDPLIYLSTDYATFVTANTMTPATEFYNISTDMIPAGPRSRYWQAVPGNYSYIHFTSNTRVDFFGTYNNTTVYSLSSFPTVYLNTSFSSASVTDAYFGFSPDINPNGDEKIYFTTEAGNLYLRGPGNSDEYSINLPGSALDYNYELQVSGGVLSARITEPGGTACNITSNITAAGAYYSYFRPQQPTAFTNISFSSTAGIMAIPDWVGIQSETDISWTFTPTSIAVADVDMNYSGPGEARSYSRNLTPYLEGRLVEEGSPAQGARFGITTNSTGFGKGENYFFDYQAGPNAYASFFEHGTEHFTALEGSNAFYQIQIDSNRNMFARMTDYLGVVWEYTVSAGSGRFYADFKQLQVHDRWSAVDISFTNTPIMVDSKWVPSYINGAPSTELSNWTITDTGVTLNTPTGEPQMLHSKTTYDGPYFSGVLGAGDMQLGISTISDPIFGLGGEYYYFETYAIGGAFQGLVNFVNGSTSNTLSGDNDWFNAKYELQVYPDSNLLARVTTFRGYVWQMTLSVTSLAYYAFINGLNPASLESISLTSAVSIYPEIANKWMVADSGPTTHSTSLQDWQGAPDGLTLSYYPQVFISPASLVTYPSFSNNVYISTSYNAQYLNGTTGEASDAVGIGIGLSGYFGGSNFCFLMNRTSDFETSVSFVHLNTSVGYITDVPYNGYGANFEVQLSGSEVLAHMTTSQGVVWEYYTTGVNYGPSNIRPFVMGNGEPGVEPAAGFTNISYFEGHPMIPTMISGPWQLGLYNGVASTVFDKWAASSNTLLFYGPTGDNPNVMTSVSGMFTPYMSLSLLGSTEPPNRIGFNTTRESTNQTDLAALLLVNSYGDLEATLATGVGSVTQAIGVVASDYSNLNYELQIDSNKTVAARITGNIGGIPISITMTTSANPTSDPYYMFFNLSEDSSTAENITFTDTPLIPISQPPETYWLFNDNDPGNWDISGTQQAYFSGGQPSSITTQQFTDAPFNAVFSVSMTTGVSKVYFNNTKSSGQGDVPTWAIYDAGSSYGADLYADGAGEFGTLVLREMGGIPYDAVFQTQISGTVLVASIVSNGTVTVSATGTVANKHPNFVVLESENWDPMGWYDMSFTNTPSLPWPAIASNGWTDATGWTVGDTFYQAMIPQAVPAFINSVSVAGNSYNVTEIQVDGVGFPVGSIVKIGYTKTPGAIDGPYARIRVFQENLENTWEFSIFDSNGTVVDEPYLSNPYYIPNDDIATQFIVKKESGGAMIVGFPSGGSGRQPITLPGFLDANFDNYRAFIQVSDLATEVRVHLLNFVAPV